MEIDLFVPAVDDEQFTVVVSTKTTGAPHTARFHHGRGTQEGIVAEMKSQGQLDYIPTRMPVGDQLYTLAAILAHNLNRELQMTVRPRQSSTTPSRVPVVAVLPAPDPPPDPHPAADRLSRTQGNLTLTTSADERLTNELL